MKKIIALILTLVICLSLCSCGQSKEKMLETARLFDAVKFVSEADENLVNAQEKYENNVFRFRGFVGEIKEDYCVLTFYDQVVYDLSGFWVKLALEKEDLAKLKTGCRTEFVGHVESVGQEHVICDTAYFVTDITEIDTKINGFTYNDVSDSTPIHYETKVDDIDGANFQTCIVYLKDDVWSELEKGDSITVKGQLMRLENYKDVYKQDICLQIKDAEIVK